MKEGQPIYDFRHQVTNACNWRCTYCLNEGLPIGKSRGGITPEVPDLKLDQIIQLYGALFEALPQQIRCFALTGGEPVLLGDKLIYLMQKLEQSGIQWWFLNSNASLITDEFADKLAGAGLPEIKVNLPSMSSPNHQKITGRNLFRRQVKGIRACIGREIKVDINIPLMRGINDRIENLAMYAGFFRRAVCPDQVEIKYLQLERGKYGDKRDREFYEKYHMPTAGLPKRIHGVFVGEEDFGRKKLYRVDVDGITMRVAIIDNCSPEQMENHPTKKTSLIITHDGRLRRMWDDTSYQFRFDVGGKDLGAQVKEALSFFEKN